MPGGAARGAPAATSPAMAPSVAPAASHDEAVPRTLVGKSSGAHERSTVVLPALQKTMAAKLGQSPPGPPRKKAASASAGPTKKTTAESPRPVRSASPPPTPKPERPI